MFLKPTNLVTYLLNRGLVAPEDIVKGSFRIHESGRRNRNYIVHRGEKPGLFVKQVPIVAEETIASVFREAACYQLAEHDPNFAALRPLVPKLHDYNPKSHCMVSELLPTAEGYTQLHLRLNQFPEYPAALLGAALSSVHSQADKMLSAPERTVAFPRIAPWVLTIAGNAESVIGNKSEGIRKMTTLLRQNELIVASLEQLAKTWRNSALIHGDIKWDNFLIRDNGNLNRQIYVVDWELADIGDPSWDVGCVFGSYLQHWFATMSADASTQDNTQLILSAPHKLQSLWPAMRAFWGAYCQGMNFTPEQEITELVRATLFAAARLVLTGYEIAFQMPTVGRTNHLCLQLATAMFADPQQSIREILGFSNTRATQPANHTRQVFQNGDGFTQPNVPQTAEI